MTFLHICPCSNICTWVHVLTVLHMKGLHMCSCSDMNPVFWQFLMGPEMCLQFVISQWAQNKTSVWVLFLSYFPRHFHTLKPCISPIRNPVPYTVREIENLELIMKLWSREMQKCTGISVQTHKPRYTLSLCEGHILPSGVILGLNPCFYIST